MSEKHNIFDHGDRHHHTKTPSRVPTFSPTQVPTLAPVVQQADNGKKVDPFVAGLGIIGSVGLMALVSLTTLGRKVINSVKKAAETWVERTTDKTGLKEPLL